MPAGAEDRSAEKKEKSITAYATFECIQRARHTKVIRAIVAK